MVTIDPIGDAVRAVELFTDVALADPLSALLIAVGGLFTVAATAVLGGLSAGAAVTFVLRLLEQPDRQE